MRQTFIPSGDDVEYDLYATKNMSVMSISQGLQ